MKQKGFILIFLLVWNLSAFSGNMTVPINQQSDKLSATKHLYFLVGCRAVIPCQHYSRNSDSFKWFYKKDERSNQNQLFFQDKNGIQYRHSSHTKWNIGSNHSLVFSHFTEDDEGMYWCETCQGLCQQSAVITVKKELWKEINETLYITAGNSFEYACSGEHGKIKWTFEATAALTKSGHRAKRDIVTFNKSIHIGNVRREDAGRYTCWIRSCDEHIVKLTINLCVVTAYGNKDSVSCAGICHTKSSNPNSNSAHVDSYKSLNCSKLSVFDGYGTVTTSHVSSDAFNKTSGIQKDSEDWVALICAISISCVILMALLIFYFSSRLCSDASALVSPKHFLFKSVAVA
ncbi:uncharacterized protein LOC115794209 [Archocentrus centrarchus]|uniref:uncharacterized protein LOC115794209 n=1 Tax=Archocentrus centrarchus TaxID=63155 RepID=UPI0011E9F822|nr:uncharacterized protein LOC115794209 [Archocentrus centrarchus]